MKIAPSTTAFDFKNRRALVTGAGKGIGRDIAEMLVRSGAQVVALSRTAEDLATLQLICQKKYRDQRIAVTYLASG